MEQASSVYRLKLRAQVVNLLIGIGIAAGAIVVLVGRDEFTPGTGIARLAETLAPLIVPLGLVFGAQSILRMRRRALVVDDSGIHSPFTWTRSAGEVAWRDIESIERVPAPYGGRKGLRIHRKGARGPVIPLDSIENGENLEDNLLRRLALWQSQNLS